MSCCSCGNNCQSGCGCRIVVLPDNPVELYQMLNINTLGIGVYDSTEGNTFQMRGIYSGNSSIVVALDAGNNAISITLNIDQIIDDLPQATTTQRGVGETATDAEAIAKASITTFLTPSNLAALGASLTFAGLVELATDAETQAGVSTTLAVTPAGLASVTATIQGTETWGDGATRAGADPDFEGQIGVQLDTDQIWISTGPAVGDFNIPVFMLDNTNNVLSAATQIDLDGQLLTFTSGDVTFAGGTFTFLTGTLDIGAGVINVNFGPFAVLRDNGVTVPANSVLTTSSTAGQFNSLLINTFLSNSNTTVWGLPTGTLSRTALAAYAGQNISNPPTEAEVQTLDDYVQELSQKMCALITDLRATLKPHAT
jgi:hypothetical protein